MNRRHRGIEVERNTELNAKPKLMNQAKATQTQSEFNITIN